jgi:5-formyltetrahydrofolate cyclo-ligase
VLFTKEDADLRDLIAEQFIAEQKQALRQEMLKRREKAFIAHPEAGQQLAQQLYALRLVHPPDVVSAYWPIRHEIDPRPFLESFHEKGGTIVLPVILAQAERLAFRLWTPDVSLRRSHWGVMEPPITCPQIEPDILLLPLLAFDQQGYRLGYGQGYYDRTVAHLRACKTVKVIALAFDEQEVSSVPHNAYDQKVDSVVTPTTLYEF